VSNKNTNKSAHEDESSVNEDRYDQCYLSMVEGW